MTECIVDDAEPNCSECLLEAEDRITRMFSPSARKKRTPTRAKKDWVTLCWHPKNRIPWPARYLFDRYCSLWFDRIQPTAKALRTVTGFRPRKIKAILRLLRWRGLLSSDVPTFQGQYLMAKRQHDPKTWWKGTQGRTVVPQYGDKADVILSHILYKNEMNQPVTVGYLAVVTSMPIRTVRWIVTALIRKGRLKRIADTGALTTVIEYEGKMVEYPTYKARRLATLVAACPTRDLRARLIEAGEKRFRLFVRLWTACTRNYITSWTRLDELLKSKGV